MTTHIITSRSITSILLLLLITALPALAANECQVYYSYTTNGGSAQGTTVDLDEGEVRAIGTSKIRYVKNKKNYPVRVQVTNLWPPYGTKWVALNSDEQQDPPSGTYGADVTLYNVECGGSSLFPTPEQMVNTLKASGVPVEQIASGLQATFNQTGAQIAELLDDANFTASQIAEALKDGLNASGQQVAQWMRQSGTWARYTAVALKDAFNASGQQVAQWMRQAGYSVNHAAQGLIEAFNATASQTAAWLAQAGYTIDQIAEALQDKFNATAEAFIAALQAEICGVAGCPSDQFARMVEALRDRYNQTAAQAYALLRQAGYATGVIVQGLKDAYNVSAAQLAEWMRQGGAAASEVAEALKDAFNATGQQVAQWLKAAGYGAAQVAQALQDVFNASAEQVAAWMQQAGYSINEVALALKEALGITVEAAAQALEMTFKTSLDAIQAALEFAGYSAAEINRWLARQITISQTYTGHASHQAPAAGPRQNFPFHTGTNQITIAGRGLLAVTSIRGVPGRVRIVGKGATKDVRGNPSGDYLHVEVDVPRQTRAGTTGQATLSMGSARGPSFGWIVAAPTRRGGGSTSPPQRGGGGGGNRRPDLEPLNTQNVFYEVGSATTTDDNGDIFTALDPFNNSAHCQGIPQGAVNRRTNQPTANTQRITVPNVQWGVANTSSVDVTDRFVVQLMYGGRTVAREQVNGLSAGEEVTFTYRRPQSETTVARVGPGGGCYHAGVRREGWNDNRGFTVEVDVARQVSEASENNNRRAL